MNSPPLLNFASPPRPNHTADVPLEPVVLLLDLSRARLERIAAEFKRSPAPQNETCDGNPGD